MRKITRTTLAATAVVGLLAIPAAGAGAASSGTTVGLVELSAATGGALEVNVPTGDFATPVDLGSVEITNGATLTTSGLGAVEIDDTRTGLVRTVTVSVTSTLTNSLASFCLDSDSGTAGLQCSEDAGEFLTLANGLYDFGTVTTGGDATIVTPTLPSVPTPLGATSASWALLAGTFSADWNPTFEIVLTGQEVAGDYYGSIVHSVL